MPCLKHSRANKPLIPYSTNEYKLFTNDTSGIQKASIYSIDGRSALALISLESAVRFVPSRDISRVECLLNISLPFANSVNPAVQDLFPLMAKKQLEDM